MEKCDKNITKGAKIKDMTQALPFEGTFYSLSSFLSSLSHPLSPSLLPSPSLSLSLALCVPLAARNLLLLLKV